MINKQDLLIQVIEHNLKATKVGLLIKNVRGINPNEVIKKIQEKNLIPLYVSAIGYDQFIESKDANGICSSRIEDAVLWRSDPKYAGKIIVFVNKDTDKLHSLAELDIITPRTLATWALKLQEESASNEPTKNFWNALSHQSDQYTLDSLLDFIGSVEDNSDQQKAIPENLWRIGLLSDPQLLATKKNPEERLNKNRYLLQKIGQLSDDSRKKLSSSLSKIENDEEKIKLKKVYNYLQQYFKYGSPDTLQLMDLDSVERLFIASKSKTKTKSKKNTTPDDPTEVDDKPINFKEQDELISESILFGSEDDKSILEDLVDIIEDSYNNPDNSQDDLVSHIGGPFENRNILLKKVSNDLRKLIGETTNKNHWGGLMVTEESVLKDAIAADKNSLEYFDPLSSESIISFKQDSGKISLFDFIKQFDLVFKDKGFEDVESFEAAIGNLISYRSQLADKIDLILNYPILSFGSKEEYRTLLINYIEAWINLYKAFTKNENHMREISSAGTDFATKAILLLDILYVRTPNEWKAILLPLHPVYLWRYYEIFKMVSTQKDDLTEDEKQSLDSVINNLPQLMNFVVANNLITNDGEDKILPCSGSIEMLPTFENKTNKYLGDDGSESITEIISRWIGYAPYTRAEIRICSVDAPNLVENIRSIKKIMETYHIKRVVYDVYLTRKQNGNNELSKLDYASRDYEISNLLQSGKLIVRIKNIDSINSINKELKEKPVHIAFFFDQSSYSIEFGPSNKNLYITPLVITYDYYFDEIQKKGSIYPSMDMDSGLIGEYHKLLRTANLITNDRNPRTTYNGNADMTSVVSTITTGGTQWLVCADRDTSNYEPQNAIPIGESTYDKRTVSIWASDHSRIISQYRELLMNYNLYPKDDVLIDLLRNFGHISSSGLISIPRFGTDIQTRINKQKGLLGTILAASWYTKAHPNSLVASLDDEKARLWLHDSKYGDERADLVGLYYKEDEDTLFIQPIEVKTRDDDSDYTKKYNNETRRNELSGHAIDQISAIVEMLKEIFTGNNTENDMFIASRREVLKYQIVTECFRNIHNDHWQQKWSLILKRAFKNRDEDTLKISISGLLLHIKLSESDNGVAEKCVNPEFDDNPIEYRRLTCSEIQSQIFDDTEIPEFIDMRTLPFKKSRLTTGSEVNNHPHSQMNTAIEKSNDVDFDETESSNVKKSIESDTSSDNDQTNENKVNADVIDSNSSSDNNPFLSEEVERLNRDFKRSCQDYNISLAECNTSNVIIGPSVVRMRFRLSRGQSVTSLQSHLDDIGREMKRNGILIQPIHNSDELFLDIPRLHREKVLFKDVVEKLPKNQSPEQLFFPLGRTPEGKDLIKNLTTLPHMLVGGSTGSGKSVFLFTLLASLLKSHPTKEELQLILSTSKMEDFIYFEGLPHLYSGKIITDAQETTKVIKEMILAESKKRGETLAQAKVANIIEYNKKSGIKMPPIVVVIDEFADLADQLDTKKEKDEFHKIVRHIAQTGRSRGIHLVVCTQRPDAKLVPNGTKSQLNGRVALRMNDGISSRMIIDTNDAKDLQKYGDMIYQNEGERERAQGYYISVEELQEILTSFIPSHK